MGVDIQAGQREFRRELARDETETARRLQASYRGFLQDLQTYLNDLDKAAEAANLTTDLKSTAEFRALEEQVREALDDLSAVIESESRRLEDKGIRRGKEYGEDQLARVFASFNRPSVPQIKELVRYVDSAPFQEKLNKYGEYHGRAIANIITADASLGKSPVTTAEHIRRWLTTMPAADAYRITRTVQIWAARKGTSAVYQANREIVLGWWWSSALDSRTCMSCVSQHGKRFSVEDTLADHHSGRCAMIPVTGYTVDRPVQTGEEWFKTLPESEQRRMMGKSKWEAWKAKEFGFDALTSSYRDDVYGTMYRAASLSEIRANKFDRQIRPEAYAPVPFEILPEEQFPLFQARLFPPDLLEDADPDDGPVQAALWELAAYDDRGSLYYNKLAIDNKYSDMLYELYKIGRDEPKPTDIQYARLNAGVLLAAYEHAEIKLTGKQKKILEGLAVGNAVDTIYQIKDNRMKTRYRTGGYTGSFSGGFQTANEIEGAQRLRESRGNRSF